MTEHIDESIDDTYGWVGCLVMVGSALLSMGTMAAIVRIIMLVWWAIFGR
jgi:hypothetical protein